MKYWKHTQKIFLYALLHIICCQILLKDWEIQSEYICFSLWCLYHMFWSICHKLLKNNMEKWTTDSIAKLYQEDEGSTNWKDEGPIHHSSVQEKQRLKQNLAKWTKWINQKRTSYVGITVVKIIRRGTTRLGFLKKIGKTNVSIKHFTTYGWSATTKPSRFVLRADILMTCQKQLGWQFLIFVTPFLGVAYL